MVCRYKHHLEVGEKLGTCKEHPEEEIQCGPFNHWCPKCDPFLEHKCLICEVKRGRCCC